MRGVLQCDGLGDTDYDPVLLSQSNPVDPDAMRAAIQRLMSTDAGVIRDAASLQLAADTLGDLAAVADALPTRDPRTYQTLNVLRVARAIVAGASARIESRGAHTRGDYPEQNEKQLGRYIHIANREPEYVPFVKVKAKARR